MIWVAVLWAAWGVSKISQVSASHFSYFELPFAAMAHRGGYWSQADKDRENSIHAFRTAVEHGFHYLETDVHTTADGKLIAFHDEVLDRVTDTSGKISELNWAEVAKARIAGIDPIPSFDEVLEEFPDSRFNIDLKAPGAVEPLAAALRSHKAEDRVCVASFSARRLNHFRRLTSGKVATSTATPGVAWAAMVPVLPRFFPMPGQAIQLPVWQIIRGIKVRVLTEQLLKTAHHHQMKVHIWTVNDVETMNELLDLGVDGIISDRIDLLQQVTQAAGLWC